MAATIPLELEAATKRYEGANRAVTALDGVDFRVGSGEFVCLFGPSGSGKSTLLNVLGLLDSLTDGTLWLEGKDVTALSVEERTEVRREYLGFIFQDYHLVPTLTAVENVELPTVFDGRGERERAEELLDRVGLGDRRGHKPPELSGGQCQRVAIARSLINRPSVLLADEPTGNLDRDTGTVILDEFQRITEEGVSVVVVTHDQLVSDYADRRFDLVDGDLG
ncbi:ABC transporter ATP-binding protein [Halorientalis sp.]|jgi:putative ABC transport system ATP-binding protein|uniref:ABC transporter ATP-binding protein n=1 Tax=Halorientalis sp. TaxID=1931229 RepID=UPI00260CE1E8|nr:ABC transporter ATP-binding protein [Halorientalis sp.]